MSDVSLELISRRRMRRQRRHVIACACAGSSCRRRWPNGRARTRRPRPKRPEVSSHCFDRAVRPRCSRTAVREVLLQALVSSSDDLPKLRCLPRWRKLAQRCGRPRRSPFRWRTSGNARTPRLEGSEYLSRSSPCNASSCEACSSASMGKSPESEISDVVDDDLCPILAVDDRECRQNLGEPLCKPQRLRLVTCCREPMHGFVIERLARGAIPRGHRRATR